MGYIRKILIIIFSGLSFCFALLAVYKHYFIANNDNLSDQTIVWSKDIELESRKSDKLIFFSTQENFSADNTCKDILNKAYLKTYIDPKSFPADYLILKFFMKDTKDIHFGVLSPKATPLFLSNQDNINLNKLLIGILKSYCDHKKAYSKEAFKQNKSIEILLNSRAKHHNDILSTAPIFSLNTFLNIELFNLNIFFKSNKCLNTPIGVFTENMKLLAFLSKKFPENKNLHNLLEIANLRLNSLLKEDLPIRQRILLCNALIESNLEIDEQKHQILLDLANEIAQKTALSKNNLPFDCLIDDALGLYYLAKYSKRIEPFNLQCIENIANALNNTLNKNNQLPSLISNTNSQAGAIEYAFLASAFAKYHQLTDDQTYFKASRNSLKKLDKYFLLSNGIWAINANDSAFAKIFRPIFFKDTNVPSYISVAYKTSLYTKYPHNENLDTFLKSLLEPNPIPNYENASLKLAYLKTIYK